MSRILSVVEVTAGLIFAAPDTTLWKAPVFSRLDSLFIIAATGEPRFEGVRDSSQKALLAEDTLALRYLLDHRLTGQTPRQRHYVETFFTLASDSGRNEKPRRLLVQALVAAPDTIRGQLLYIASQMKDTAFRREAFPYLHSDSVGVRRMAVRCLGAYPNPENLPLLWDGLALRPFDKLTASQAQGPKISGKELQQRLWALDAQGPVRDWKKLVPLMSDSLFFNRQKIRDMILRAADSSWEKVREAVPPHMADDERLEWCLLALNGKGGLRHLDSTLPGLRVEECSLLNQYRKIRASKPSDI